MRILVTGASGFLGQHLAAALVKRADFVVALVRDITPARPASHVIVHGSFEQIERTIAEYECDAVVHLAAQTQVSTAAKDPESTLETNVLGTWKVLSACRRQGVKRVIVASSDKAYGAGPTPYSEEQLLQPHGIYATSKAMADHCAHSFITEYGMSIAITRCGNLFGPGHVNWSTLIPGAIDAALRMERLKLRHPKSSRDYLYVDDAVAGYLKLLNSEHVGAFNFGTGVATPAHIVADMIYREIDLKNERDQVTALGEGGAELDCQYLSCNKAMRLLGWQAEDSLLSGLHKTIPWYKNHRVMYTMNNLKRILGEQ